ncbi:hypothetical protein BO82DRAFT_354141 [Aspergillus uvarum CBS 121591]|uniref:Secreted protein n=1 Tax=Aspergillus uvarum CBS 121591 TaxID=1448315 RepID=A0A319CT70_9EURO|nr:hypothetical protein BO82DRAFT_354141 [Aspergillus uvarum CBS 121591]PYH81973.1 hypothetical protein BO82DRAFT_354141 [Aspergillus uvarum CBS 121591]
MRCPEAAACSRRRCRWLLFVLVGVARHGRWVMMSFTKVDGIGTGQESLEFNPQRKRKSEQESELADSPDLPIFF